MWPAPSSSLRLGLVGAQGRVAAGEGRDQLHVGRASRAATCGAAPGAPVLVEDRAAAGRRIVSRRSNAGRRGGRASQDGADRVHERHRAPRIAGVALARIGCSSSSAGASSRSAGRSSTASCAGAVDQRGRAPRRGRAASPAARAAPPAPGRAARRRRRRAPPGSGWRARRAAPASSSRRASSLDRRRPPRDRALRARPASSPGARAPSGPGRGSAPAPPRRVRCRLSVDPSAGRLGADPHELAQPLAHRLAQHPQGLVEGDVDPGLAQRDRRPRRRSAARSGCPGAGRRRRCPRTGCAGAARPGRRRGRRSRS